jgi:CheY-like chemotaxis protein
MVVEDDDRIRETLRDLLQIEGYEVSTAANGREALDQLSIAQPDLILLDMLMPTMDGAEFLAAMRRDRELAGIPVTVLSASRIEPCVAMAPCLRKPFDLDDLLAHVRRYCG